MKRWIQLMSVMALMSGIVGTPVSVVASTQTDQVKSDASKNAASLVIKQGERPSKSSINKFGKDYADDFWQHYRQFSEQYWQAYRQGISDVQNQVNDWQAPDDRVQASGYQAGREDAVLGINKLADQKVNQNHNTTEKPESQVQFPKKEEMPIPESPFAIQDETPGLITPEHDFSMNQPPASQPQGPATDNDHAEKSDDTKEAELSPVIVDATGRAFIKKMAPLAQEVSREYDLYPSVMLAQAALESNWGRSELANHHHNLFGVKATDGLPSVLMPTTECDGQGKAHTEKAKFRKYQSNKESLLDYANTLSDPMYNGAHRKQAHTWRQATAALNGKYATDPHYSAKLNAIIRGANLTRYDKINHQRKVSHHWEPFTSRTRAVKPAKDQPSKAHHDHTDLATLGILGGAGSFSLFGFFRHLFGA